MMHHIKQLLMNNYLPFVVDVHSKYTYMPTKPSKYGIKIWNLCDSRTFYCCNIDVYLGKIENTVERKQGQRVVKQLTDFWQNSNRIITIDNFFTDITLTEEMLQNFYCWHNA